MPDLVGGVAGAMGVDVELHDVYLLLDLKTVSAADQAVAFREGVVAQVLLVEESTDLEASAVCVELCLEPAARDVRGSGDDLVGVCVPQEGVQIGDPVCQGDGLRGGVILDSVAASGVAVRPQEAGVLDFDAVN